MLFFFLMLWHFTHHTTIPNPFHCPFLCPIFCNSHNSQMTVLLTSQTTLMAISVQWQTNRLSLFALINFFSPCILLHLTKPNYLSSHFWEAFGNPHWWGFPSMWDHNMTSFFCYCKIFSDLFQIPFEHVEFWKQMVQLLLHYLNLDWMILKTLVHHCLISELNHCHILRLCVLKTLHCDDEEL